MSTNKYFNLKRFRFLLKQDLLINKTKYVLGVLGLGLVSYLFLYWFLYSNEYRIINNEGSINNVYMIGFMFYIMGVGVVVGTAFPDLTTKIKTANYLLSPASLFEKILLQFLLRIIIFVPLALLLFWITVRLAKASLVPKILFNKFFDPNLVPYFDFSVLITNGVGKLLDPWQILFMIFGLFSYGIYLFSGPTFFRRFAFIKTTILSGIFFGVCILFMMLLSKIFFPVKTKGFEIQLPDYQITDYLSASQIFMLTMAFFSWLFFLCMAYFKLKEKEV